jgi:hypothetical protein
MVAAISLPSPATSAVDAPAWVARRHNPLDAAAAPGSGIPVQAARASALDEDGNLYLTGSIGNGTDEDFLTMKYGPGGELLWWRAHDGGLNDWGYGLSLHPDGGVVVVGNSQGAESSNDFLTVAYDEDGEERWAARWGGAERDYPVGLVVDDAGRTYVAGSTSTETRDDDIVTLAYDDAGQELWSRTYDRALTTDYPRRVVLDSQGVVVVGSARLDGLDYDMVTLAYGRDGDERWVDLHGESGQDDAYDAAVDGAGNIYVAGIVDNGTNDDAEVVSYDPDGVERWAFRHDGGIQDHLFGVAVDEETGDVVVAGQAYRTKGERGDYDFMAIRLDPAGELRWEAVHDRGPVPIGTGDFGHALALDDDGAAYVTGASHNGQNYDYLTWKVLPDGTEAWIAVHDGGESDHADAVLIDRDGNPIVLGFSALGAGSDIAAIEYDGDTGDVVWSVREPPTLPGGEDRPGSGAPLGHNAVAVDAAGAVYVTGRGSNATTDGVVTVKYADDGTEEWAAVYDGGLEDHAYAIEVDDQGNTTVVGSVFVDAYMGQHWDLQALSYDRRGRLRWSARWDGFYEDRGTDVAIDDDGNVYVTGRTDTGSSFDVLTVKYRPNGKREWVKKWDSPNGLNDTGVAIDVGADGNSYVAATTGGPGAGDATTISYSPDGTLRWAKIEAGVADDRAVDLETGPDGNIYVLTTYMLATATGALGDLTTFSYRPDGTERWSRWIDSPAIERAVDLSTGPHGVYVVGTTGVASPDDPLAPQGTAEGTAVLTDAVVARYALDGVEIWTREYDGGGVDVARGAVALPGGGVAVVARSAGTASDDFVTLRYDAAGLLLQTHRWDGGGADDPAGIAAGASGITVVGTSAGQGADYLTLRYAA